MLKYTDVTNIYINKSTDLDRFYSSLLTLLCVQLFLKGHVLLFQQGKCWFYRAVFAKTFNTETRPEFSVRDTKYSRTSKSPALRNGVTISQSSK